MSYTTSLKTTQISDFVESIVMFYMPEGGIIYDPTAGVKNYQFKWNKNEKLTGVRYTYLSSDLRKTRHSQFMADVRHLPLADKFADFTWYDPPYLPKAADKDKRRNDYGIDNEQADPQQVARYYGPDVMRELVRVTRKYIAIRGSDFYYPRTSANFYMFHDLCIQNLRKYCIIIALYQYKVLNPLFGLWRKRIKSKRPIITHNYTVVGLIQ